MISDSGETSSERGDRMQQQQAAASSSSAAAAAVTTRSPMILGVVATEDDKDIFHNSSNSDGSNSKRKAAATTTAAVASTVNGRSPRLQGLTGALLNRVDPLSPDGGSGGRPTTALNIMRRSAGSSRNVSDTSGSGGAISYTTQDGSGGVPRSVMTKSISPSVVAAETSKSKTPITSNVVRDNVYHDELQRRNHYNNNVSQPLNSVNYQPSQLPIPPPGQGGGGYNPQQFAAHAHDIHRARWEQEQRELAADYYPSASNYPHDYYNSPGRYYQPPPASLRYHQHNMDTAAASIELQRMQVEQYLAAQQQQLPSSMIAPPQQTAQQQPQHQQQQQTRVVGQEGLDSKVHGRSASPSLSSLHRNQVQQRRNHQQTLQQQQQQTPHAYEERDWRTNQVWREDDHSHTANMAGGPTIPTPPAAASDRPERRPSDKPSKSEDRVDLQVPGFLYPQMQRAAGGVNTIDQYDITAGHIYGHNQKQKQQQPPHPAYVSETPSPPPAPSGSIPSTPMMNSIDPRIQHQMNLMAMMFPPQISPIPPHLGRGGLMYPPQYYPQHNFYQGGVVGGQPPMPVEVVVPTPSSMATEAGNVAAAAPASSVPNVSPMPMPQAKKSLKKQVSFSHLQIRTYETILGDNPSCTGGPSLSIGWRYNPEHFNSTVDEYERKQDQMYGGVELRPQDIDLVLHRSERESILLKTGYTRQDLAEAVRKLNKAKNRRRQTVHNLSAPVMFFEEKAESFKRSAGRLFLNRQRTRHMYEDWKKSGSVSSSGGDNAPNQSILKRRNSL